MLSYRSDQPHESLSRGGSLRGNLPANEAWPAARYRFNGPAAIQASLVAATAITLYMLFVPRWLGIEEMDIGITVGALSGSAAGLARLAWHVGNGIIYVFPYAALLVRWQKQSTAWTGAVFGFFLWLVGPMLLIPFLLNPHPRVGMEGWTNPGIFMVALGLGWKPAAIDLVAHLVHGVLAGAVYKHRSNGERPAVCPIARSPMLLPLHPTTPAPGIGTTGRVA